MLHPFDEQALVQWCLFKNQWGHLCNFEEISDEVINILRAREEHNRDPATIRKTPLLKGGLTALANGAISQNWFNNFRSHNQQLK